MATQPQFTEFLGVGQLAAFPLAELVESGLPVTSLALLRDAGVTFTEISQIIISPRTLQHRKARSESLSKEETDRLVRVARTLALAETIFGNRSKALVWLRTSDITLANRTPISLLQTESGGRLVESMLWQIDEGVYT